MEFVILLICLGGFSLPLGILVKQNEKLRRENMRLTEEAIALSRQCSDYRWKYYSEMTKNQFQKPSNECTKNIPKGTIQAVKEAMKRSHPDNGGKAEDFQMYRRAYNVLIGKEKL